MPDEIVARALRVGRDAERVEVGERAYERGRLERAAKRPLTRKAPMQYVVKGNDEPEYDVNLTIDTPCTCKDAMYHGRGCLHELAAWMAEGDEGLLVAWGMLELRRQRASGDEEEDETTRFPHGEP